MLNRNTPAPAYTGDAAPRSTPRPSSRRIVQQLSSYAAPQRVLIVDDDEDSRIIYERFLGLAGFETTTTGSAMEAFTRARSAPPSAVLLDLVLPDMHGSELALLFRSTPGLEHIPIVGITARVTPELLKNPEAVPVARLLIKPATGEQLVDAIRDSVRTSQRIAAPEAAALPRASSRDGGPQAADRTTPAAWGGSAP